MAAIVLTFWLLVTSIFCGCTLAATVINASAIPYEDQNYDFKYDNLCRLLAHKSIILKNKTHHLLVLDGGFGKFKFNWRNQDYEVADLNRYTVAFNLNSSFRTKESPKLILQHPKRLPSDGGAPVLSQFGIWSDSTQNAIYIQGGHFLAAPPWNESLYHVPKPKIPENNNLWRFDLLTNEWKDITGETAGAVNTRRTFGGAACSVPALNQSFWLGGITDPYSSATSPAGSFSPQSQFLIHDHSQRRIRNETYYNPPSDAYWHGTLDHLQVGPGKGFLISLMSQREKGGQNFSDIGPQNDERGQNVTFTGVMLYDIDKNTWYNQSTSVFKNEEPPYRTRFCSVVVHEEGSKSWELWLFGGQGLDPNQTTGTGDAWVLTMPAFVWTRIDTANADRNGDIRSHTCHAIGSQLLVVGGYSLGENINPNTSCDQYFIKVLDINTGTWQTEYSTGTSYKVHKDVASRTALEPDQGRWADLALKEAFSYSTTTRSQRLSPGAIVGIVISIVVVLGAVALVAIPKTRKGLMRQFRSALSSGNGGSQNDQSTMLTPSSRQINQEVVELSDHNDQTVEQELPGQNELTVVGGSSGQSEAESHEPGPEPGPDPGTLPTYF